VGVSVVTVVVAGMVVPFSAMIVLVERRRFLLTGDRRLYPRLRARPPAIKRDESNSDCENQTGGPDPANGNANGRKLEFHERLHAAR
jgi:hypothetical protein